MPRIKAKAEKFPILVLHPYLNDSASAIYTNKEVDAKIEDLIARKAKEGATEGAKSL